MAIDVTLPGLRSELISFRELAAQIPPARNGRPVHVSTLHRWRVHGLKKVRLDAIRIGGAWYTSSAAFQRFCDGVTANRSNVTTGHVLTKDAATSVDAALELLGYGDSTVR